MVNDAEGLKSFEEAVNGVMWRHKQPVGAVDLR
jgi:hypothetical protein